MSRFTANAVNGLRDTSRNCYVIVLYQDRVVETEAVIEAAAGPHRIFFQRAKSRDCFPRADYAGRKRFNNFN